MATATKTNKKFDWCYDKKLSEHKTFEIQLTHWNQMEDWFDFNLKWSRMGDHCGPNLMLELFGWFFCIHIYDHRHWNWDENRFYIPGEEWAELAKLEEQVSGKNFCGPEILYKGTEKDKIEPR